MTELAVIRLMSQTRVPILWTVESTRVFTRKGFEWARVFCPNLGYQRTFDSSQKIELFTSYNVLADFTGTIAK